MRKSFPSRRQNLWGMRMLPHRDLLPLYAWVVVLVMSHVGLARAEEAHLNPLPVPQKECDDLRKQALARQKLDDEQQKKYAQCLTQQSGQKRPDILYQGYERPPESAFDRVCWYFGCTS